MSIDNGEGEKVRTTLPDAISLTFSGPEGIYNVYFRPIDDWGGTIEVSIGGHPMQRPVNHSEKRKYKEDRHILIGTSANDLLVVVHTERDDRNRIISARRAEPNERRYYHEQNQ